jgi:hypothetical protein
MEKYEGVHEKLPGKTGFVRKRDKYDQMNYDDVMKKKKTHYKINPTTLLPENAYKFINRN